MNLNVEKFKDVLRKGTVNYLVDSIGITVDPTTIKCNMLSTDRSALVFLNLPNNMIEDLNETINLNFTEPNTKVKPYLEILDEETVPITITDSMIKINKQLKINFDDESVISVYGSDNPRNEIEYFLTMVIDDEFMNNYKKIQKVGSRFGKIYFVVKDKKLYIESTDKTNSYSNSVKFFVSNVEHEDLNLCFKYKNFINLMTLIAAGDFSLNLCYVEDQKLGLISMIKTDESERYFLMSTIE